jgi:hypothetical protein
VVQKKKVGVNQKGVNRKTTFPPELKFQRNRKQQAKKVLKESTRQHKSCSGVNWPMAWPGVYCLAEFQTYNNQYTSVNGF